MDAYFRRSCPLCPAVFGYLRKKPNFRKRTQPSCHENPWIFALLWAGLLAAVAAFAGQPVAELYDKAEYRIAMRDSVALYTAVYTPKAPGEAPVIIFVRLTAAGPMVPDASRRGLRKAICAATSTAAISSSCRMSGGAI